MLREYTETLEFMVYGSAEREHWLLLPSELDLASRRKQIADQEKELERLEKQQAPLEIRQARLTLNTLEGAALDAAKAKIAAYENRLVAEQQNWETALWRSQALLEQMERLAEKAFPEGGRPVKRRFQMREFSQAERLAADEDHSELVEIAGVPQKNILVERRNLALLGKALLGEWVPVEGEAQGQVKTFEDKPHVLRPIQDPSQLQNLVAAVLVDRMWATNQMAPELMGFFGPQPKPLRLQGGSPTASPTR